MRQLVKFRARRVARRGDSSASVSLCRTDRTYALPQARDDRADARQNITAASYRPCALRSCISLTVRCVEARVTRLQCRHQADPAHSRDDIMTLAAPLCVLLDITQQQTKRRRPDTDGRANDNKRCCSAKSHGAVPFRAQATSKQSEDVCVHRDGRPCHASVLRDTPPAGATQPAHSLARVQHAGERAPAASDAADACGVSAALRVPLAPLRDVQIACVCDQRAAKSEPAAADMAGRERAQPGFAQRFDPQAQLDWGQSKDGSVAAAMFRGPQCPVMRKEPVQLGHFLPPIAAPVAPTSSERRGESQHQETRTADQRAPLPAAASVADTGGARAASLPKTSHNGFAPSHVARSDVSSAACVGSNSIAVHRKPCKADCTTAICTVDEQLQYVLDEQDAVCDQRLFKTIDLSRGVSPTGLLSAEAAIPWWFKGSPAHRVLS